MSSEIPADTETRQGADPGAHLQPSEAIAGKIKGEGQKGVTGLGVDVEQQEVLAMTKEAWTG